MINRFLRLLFHLLLLLLPIVEWVLEIKRQKRWRGHFTKDGLRDSEYLRKLRRTADDNLSPTCSDGWTSGMINLTTAYHPQTNEIIEHFYRQLKTAIKYHSNDRQKCCLSSCWEFERSEKIICRRRWRNSSTERHWGCPVTIPTAGVGRFRRGRWFRQEIASIRCNIALSSSCRIPYL